MLSCPKDELRVLEKLLRPSPELELDPEMVEEDWEAQTAEATAESILGSRAAMICAMMSACDRLPLLGFGSYSSSCARYIIHTCQRSSPCSPM